MPKLLIYLLGLVPLAFVQSWLRQTLGDLASFGLIIAYLLLLRFIADRYGKKTTLPSGKADNNNKA